MTWRLQCIPQSLDPGLPQWYCDVESSRGVTSRLPCMLTLLCFPYRVVRELPEGGVAWVHFPILFSFQVIFQPQLTYNITVFVSGYHIVTGHVSALGSDHPVAKHSTENRVIFSSLTFTSAPGTQEAGSECSVSCLLNGCGRNGHLKHGSCWNLFG